MPILRRAIWALLAPLLLASAACSSSTTDPEGQGIDDPASETTCFTEMTPDQQRDLEEYARQQGSQVDRSADGKTVCVIDSQGNARYYNKEDNFSQYLLYTMLLGRSSALLTYGFISGDLDTSQFLMLSLLTGTDRDGNLYRPYSSTNQGWAREPEYLNRKVGTVYYGSSTTGYPYQEAKAKAPTKYRWENYPRATEDVADVKKDTSGRTTVNKSTGMTASEITRSSTRTKVTKNVPFTRPTVKPRVNNPGNTGNNGNTWGSKPNKPNAPAAPKVPPKKR